MVLFWFVLVPWGFVRYGEWIDASQQPQHADVIFCLGGGTVERLKKATQLCKAGYAKSGKVLLIGESYESQAELAQRYPGVTIEQHHKPQNTKEEVLFIKNYMQKHGYRSALVVTDPPHSRRVAVLDAILDVEGAADLNLYLVGSEVSWWRAERYFDHNRSARTVLAETLRILYSIPCYGMIERLGGSCE